MSKIFLVLFTVGIVGVANSFPSQPPSFHTDTVSTTEKIISGSSPSGTKDVKVDTTANTTPAGGIVGTNKPVTKQEISASKPASDGESTVKIMSAPVPTTEKNEKNEEKIVSTPKEQQQSTTFLPSQKKPEATVPSQDHKATSTTTINSKGAKTTPSTKKSEEPTTFKPKDEEMNKKPKHPKKNTAYLDEGKIVIFNGICGPQGCEIEGDVYDDIVPITHSKQRG